MIRKESEMSNFSNNFNDAYNNAIKTTIKHCIKNKNLESIFPAKDIATKELGDVIQARWMYDGPNNLPYIEVVKEVKHSDNISFEKAIRSKMNVN